MDWKKKAETLDEIAGYFEICSLNADPTGKAKTKFLKYVEELNALSETLKKQEPVWAKIMGEPTSHGSWWFACGACGHAIDPEDNFCRECGREIKWDD